MSVGSLKLIRVLSVLFLACGCASAAFAQTFTTYGGEATALSGTVAGIPVNLAATGAIDPSGGARNNSLVCYPGGPLCNIGVPDATSGLLSAQVLSATAVGQGDTTYAHSSMGKLSLLVQGLLIKAEYVDVDVKSVCKEDGNGGKYSESKGRSEFSQLTIAGSPVSVTGLPNQVVRVASPLGGLVTVVINEQVISNGYLTVRALHVMAPSIAGVVNASDVSVATGKTKIDCADVEKCFARKVTGGGFVIDDTGAKITFAVSGRELGAWGHIVAINHETGDKFKGTPTTTLFGPATEGGGESAFISGTGEMNGSGPFLFIAEVQDNDEPGKNVDKFGLAVGEVEPPPTIVPFDTIDGGNIQFHKSKPSECPGDDPPPEE